MKTKELLSNLEITDNTFVLSLINSSKRPQNIFGTQIALDILPLLYLIFEKNKNKDNIAIILRSNGGVLEAPLPIVNLIREYFKKYTVLIPENAHSAATLLALGADEIIMTPFSSLSPVDPQITLGSNIGENKGLKNMSFSVEDVAGYYKLLDKLKITKKDKVKALELLTKDLSPTLLGQIERIRELINLIADKIIHCGSINKKSLIKKLTGEIPSHNYLISRNEAKELGLPIKNASEDQHEILKQLMTEYKNMFFEDGNEVSIELPKGSATIEKEYDRAIIETINISYSFKTKYIFHQNGKIDRTINNWIMR